MAQAQFTKPIKWHSTTSDRHGCEFGYTVYRSYCGLDDDLNPRYEKIYIADGFGGRLRSSSLAGLKTLVGDQP